MAQVGTATVKVIPDVDPAAFRDVAVLVAAVKLHEAIFHADTEWLNTLPEPVLEAFSELQNALQDVRR